MRLLFLTPQLPYPPHQGTALRNWGLISNLAQRHEIWLMSFDDSPSLRAGEKVGPKDRGVRANPSPLQQACAQIAVFPVPRRSTSARLRTLITSSLPDMAWRLWSPGFERGLNDWLRDHAFDVIQIEGIELARYLLSARSNPRYASRNTKFVFDDHNCETMLQHRTFETDVRKLARWHGAAYSFVQWQRLREFERRVIRAADATLCVSPQDGEALRQLAPGVQPHTIYNGIDVASYSTYHLPITNHQQPTIVFTGKMDFRPNVDAMLWFAQDIWPMIRQAHPNVQLNIVGQKPSPRLDPLRADSSITLTGRVEDVRPHIAQADVYIAPLLAGGGTRFKLLEAMAMRRAIVTTTLGCEGFDVTSGRELIVADEAQAFAGAVIELLRSEPRRRALGERAHAFVSVTYDWRQIVPKLEDVYRDLCPRLSNSPT
jgi:sugar transferase (PEP-CTERM/EpsH1 system associated)